MNFYTFYTPSHEYIYEEFFIKSFPHNELTLHSSKFDQLCESANYRDHGWKDTMLHKMDTVIHGLESNIGDLIVHGDCDIQFFPPGLKDTLIQELGDYDIAFQDDGTRYCAGFFVCRSSKLIIDLFQEIKSNLHKFPDDQEALQYFLKYKYKTINCKVLSYKFYTYASETNWQCYNSLDKINFTKKDILMHHANYTIGVENKISIMSHIRDNIMCTK
jgi:hypothetical protein